MEKESKQYSDSGIGLKHENFPLLHPDIEKPSLGYYLSWIVVQEQFIEGAKIETMLEFNLSAFQDPETVKVISEYANDTENNEVRQQLVELLRSTIASIKMIEFKELK